MTPEIVLHQKLSDASRRIRLLLVFRRLGRTLCWMAEPRRSLLRIRAAKPALST